MQLIENIADFLLMEFKMRIAVILFFLLFNITTSGQILFTPYPLQQAVTLIKACPESRRLLQKVEKDGPITFAFHPVGKGPFSACWIGEQRTLLLNASNEWTLGEKISSILFELHNALKDTDFENLNLQAQRGTISKDYYVETIEFIEFENSIKTKNIITNGINRRFFPKDAALNTYKNFQEHFFWQKKLGHSQLMADQYDDLKAEGIEKNLTLVKQNA
jgi:hypothetical protein